MGHGPESWWQEYTGVPAEFWKELGVKFGQTAVIFTWYEGGVRKQREANSKEFSWLPEGVSSPPLWPAVPDHVGKTVYITEGESDTGIARYIGLEAYGLTKGAGTRRLDDVWREFRNRGAEAVVFLTDIDAVGEKASQDLARQAQAANLETWVISLKTILDPMRGEKDLRDYWRRLNHSQDSVDRDKVRETVCRLARLMGTRENRRISVRQFLASDISEKPWLVERIALAQTIQMIVGLPKLGKSWLGLDLCIAIASGEKFLGEFEVLAPGPVVYVGKEDPDYLLHDRIAKIFDAKGLGGRVVGNSIEFPPDKNIPFFLDLEREFLFTDESQVASLMRWLDVIKAEYGYIAMVIFDPILRMISGIDEFKASDVSSSIFAVSESIRAKYGATVMLVHHRSKGNAEGKGSYGSVAFHAFSDGTAYLLGDSPDADGFVSVRQEFKSAPETLWGYHLKELETNYVVEVRRDQKIPIRSDSVRDLVMQTLSRSFPKGMKIEDICEALPQTSEVTVRAVLKEMFVKGDVRKEKDLSEQRPGAKKDIWYAEGK